MAASPVVAPAFLCSRMTTVLLLGLALTVPAHADDKAAPGARDKVEKTAKRAGKFVEKTAKRSVKFVEKTAKRTGKAVENAADKTESWVRRQTQ